MQRVLYTYCPGLQSRPCSSWVWGNSAEATQPGEIQIELQEQDGSNVAGFRAVLTFTDKDNTKVLIDGLDTGEPSGGGQHPAFIRRGSCAEPGAIAARLQPLCGGTSSSTVDLGLAELLAGDFAITVLLTPNQREVIACGERLTKRRNNGLRRTDYRRASEAGEQPAAEKSRAPKTRNPTSYAH